MLSNQNDPIVDDVDNDESVNNSDNDEDEEVVITAAKTTTTTPPPPQKQCGITHEQNVFKSGGREFEFWTPSTHNIQHKNKIKKWKHSHEKLWRVRNKLQANKYETFLVKCQMFWAVAMSATPALGHSTAQFLFPTMFLAFFHDVSIQRL